MGLKSLPLTGRTGTRPDARDPASQGRWGCTPSSLAPTLKRMRTCWGAVARAPAWAKVVALALAAALVVSQLMRSTAVISFNEYPERFGTKRTWSVTAREVAGIVETPDEEVRWRSAAGETWHDINVGMARAFFGTAEKVSARRWESWVARVPNRSPAYARWSGSRQGAPSLSPGEVGVLSRQLAGLMEHLPPWRDALAHQPRGVVIAAGGPTLTSAFQALWALRQTGSALPVELWMFASERPSPEVQTFLTERYGATVRVIDGLLPELAAGASGPPLVSEKIYGHTFPFSSGRSFYALKMLALAFSSFREVLLLDADNLPMRDPGPLFDLPEYKRHGVLMWPDFWAMQYDPQLLEAIAGALEGLREGGWEGPPQPVGPAEAGYRNPRLDAALWTDDERRSSGSGDTNYAALDAAVAHLFHPPRWSHESGQVLLDRARHFDTAVLAVMLMAYPNRAMEYMLSTRGIGDKEMVPWATTMLGKDYALCPHAVQAVGTHDHDGGLTGHSMLQSGPADGLMQFLHTNEALWLCRNTPAVLRERDLRFSDTMPGGRSLRAYSETREWLEAGGRPWYQFEESLWAQTRAFCAM